MKLFAHHGLHDFILCLGYKSQMIKEYFLNYEAMNSDFTIQLGSKHGLTYHGTHAEQNFQVTLAETGTDALTGARIKRIEHHLRKEPFLVTYGDGVSNVDIGKLLAFHRSHGKLVTVTTVRPSSRFGILELGKTAAWLPLPRSHRRTAGRAPGSSSVSRECLIILLIRTTARSSRNRCVASPGTES